MTGWPGAVLFKSLDFIVRQARSAGISTRRHGHIVRDRFSRF